MLIGVIADDFTGASDIANTLAKGVAPEGGLRTAQFAGVPNVSADPTLEAGVISLKSRSAPVDEAVADSLAALQWLRDQGCEQIIFKYCSTFDSTRAGNIGPVADALADALDAKGVLVCPAFPTTGRTVYQGHLFVFDRLLSESGMQHHPLTPMTDPDLRRWLGHQTKSKIGHLPLKSVLAGVHETKNILSTEMMKGSRFIVADAVTDDDLLALGETVAGRPLVTGGSGIALGLPRNLIQAGKAKGDGVQYAAVTGPEAILAGSCSGATRGQVALHAKNHPTLAIDVLGVMSGTVTVANLVAFIKANRGLAPLVYSSGTPEEVKDLQSKYGREAVSAKLDELFATTAQQLLKDGYRRIVVAGGETSGAVAKAIAEQLDASAMKIGPEIDPGVPILTLGTDQPVALALKSGNFGAEDFFAKALQMMEDSS
ncbi:3-oxo-tetronate kinase [uncultured Roseobacter sp.]|uniref:3-oxo-tetronate kinase n=1 Tax=uncultured Roseobacter sp. TaxID=114847 RepID=UPI002605A959|nr:3-oxo-tetronate kinase [uncultured Roseobacter sp.]